MGNLTTLTKKGADNLERSLESLKEKDLTIRRMQEWAWLCVLDGGQEEKKAGHGILYR